MNSLSIWNRWTHLCDPRASLPIPSPYSNLIYFREYKSKTLEAKTSNFPPIVSVFDSAKFMLTSLCLLTVFKSLVPRRHTGVLKFV